MFRRNLHRGITAIVFAAALVLAGARPAAADGLSLRNVWSWLSELWGGITQSVPMFETSGTESESNGGPVTGSTDPAPDGDGGPEIDPDGKPRP